MRHALCDCCCPQYPSNNAEATNYDGKTRQSMLCLETLPAMKHQ